MFTIKRGILVQLKIFNALHSKFNPFACSPVSNSLLDVSPLLADRRKALHCANNINNVIRLIQAILLWIKYSRNKSDLKNGENLLTLSFWAMVAFTSHINPSYARHGPALCAAVTSSVLNTRTVQNSQLLRLWVCSIPFVYISVSFIYLFLTAVTNLEPISATVASMESTWKMYPLVVRLTNISMFIFENLYFTMQVGIGCLILYQCMISCYMALYLRTKELLLDTIASKNVLVSKYYSLQICAILVNDCFQQNLALQFKFGVILTSIVFGTIACDTDIQSSMSINQYLISVYFWLITYWLMIAGYYFPGKVNSYSNEIIRTFKRNLFGTNLKVNKRNQINCLRSMRVEIGSANFYERCTALNILDFVLAQTVNVILLI